MAAKKLVNWVLKPLEWFYPTAKMLFWWRKRYAYKRYDKGPIVILQMGKVGSKSVRAGLEASVSDRQIYHTHFLSRERTAETEKIRKMYFRTARQGSLTKHWTSQFLLRSFEAHGDDHTWKLITLTREPIGRNISAFFENLDVVQREADGEFEIKSDYYKIEPTIVSVSDTGTLAELFFTKARHDSPLRFFEREIKDIFGVDVLGSGFPIEKGYEIYRAARVELLVMKLEKLADCAGAAFDEFLGLPDFKLINQNVGAKKVYAPLYSALKKNIVVDAAYAEKLLDSEYMRTFYSPKEIGAARDTWLKQTDQVSS